MSSTNSITTKRALQARHAAVAELIRRHASEFEQLHAHERVQRNLSPETGSQTWSAMRQRINELEQELARRSA